MGGRNTGMGAGLLGCVFAVLGIFTFGIVFVPIAFVCSLIGLLRGASGLSASGLGASALGLVLSFVAAATSPVFLLAMAGVLGAAVSR